MTYVATAGGYVFEKARVFTSAENPYWFFLNHPNLSENHEGDLTIL